MLTIKAAAANGDWSACKLDLVAAFDAVPRDVAREVATELVALLREEARTSEPGVLAFHDNATELLEMARGMDGPDDVIALASAITNCIAALARAERGVGAPAPPDRSASEPGILSLMVTKPARVSAKAWAWAEVERALSDRPELAVLAGDYKPGPSHGLALWAISAGSL